MATIEPNALFALCQKDKCKTLIVQDTSGVYDVATNPLGWEPDGVTIVVRAEITVTFPDGTVTVYDVLSQIPNPIEGFFNYTLTNNGNIFPDGSYKVKYELEFASGTINYKETCHYFYCNVKCGKAEIWAKVAKEECGCEPCSGNELMSTALLVEGLYRALLSAVGCNNTAIADKHLVSLNRIFDFNDCNCN
jgi:hypothetical protein